jgi:hypothetical protein
MKVGKNYLGSLVLQTIIIICLLVLDWRVLNLTIKFIYQINWLYYVLGGLGGLLAIYSFLFPYISVNLSFKKKGFAKAILKTLTNYTFLECMGEDSHSFMLKKFKHNNIKAKKALIKAGDLLAILIITTIGIWFTPFNNFFYAYWVFMVIFIGCMLIYWLPYLKKGLGSMIGFSLIRYILEFPKVFLILLALNLNHGLAFVIVFMATTSMLYFVPGFKNAVGLLVLYMVFFFISQGVHPWYGFLVAIAFRLNAIVFYLAPYILIKKIKIY